MLYTKKILFDQLTPITIFSKLKNYFGDELTFLFESAINSEEGNFSFLFIGARERIIHKDGKALHIDENCNENSLGDNPFDYLKKRYATLNNDKYKKYGQANGLGFVDGFIGYIGYDTVKIFEPRLKSHMDSLKSEIDIPDMDLMRPKLVCTFSHKSNTLTLHTFMDSFAPKLDEIEMILKEPHNYLKIKKSIINTSKGSFAFSKKRFF